MSQWREVSLGEITNKIGSGATPKGGGESYKESGISLIRSQNVLDFKFSTNGLAFIDDSQAYELRNVSVEKDDVLLNITGDSVARCCVVPESVLPARVNQHVAIIRANKEISDNHYIYYSLQALKEELLMQSEIGATRNALTKGMLESLKISIPPLEEQKAIASVLSSLDNKIDLLHRQNTTLERMAETLFRQWFLEEAQEDWEEKSLKDVCQINNGYAFQSETYRELGQKIIRTMNFNNHWIELNSLVYISDELAKSFEKYYLKRNDFLLVMVGASLGNFAIVTDDVLPSLQNQNMWCFRAHESNFQHYLNFALRNIINDSLNGASGSAREFFQKGVFYEIKVLTPPEDLILKFHDVSESYFSKIELNRKQIKTLEKLRDNLLPKLMSGEVRVV